MSVISQALSTGSVMSMYEADLSGLASKAAIEIDNVILGLGKKQDAIRRLAKRLSQSLDETIKGTECRSLMNPTAVSIMGRAINKGATTKIASVEQIIVEAKQIADTLCKFNSSSSKEQLEEIRTFCVALSMSAASHHVSIANVRPKHHFRK